MWYDWFTVDRDNSIDWEKLECFPHADAMRACIQDPVHHAEGDVWTHTKMVLAKLPPEAHALRGAAIYHDVAKPQTMIVEYDQTLGREVVRHPRHARIGAQIAWHDMYLDDVPLSIRLGVYWVCMWHQKVFHLWTQPDIARSLYEFQIARSYHETRTAWKALITFAMADNAGRICPNQKETAESLALLEELAHEHNHRFESSHARRFYLEGEGRSHLYVPHDNPKGSRVYVTSGLPGSGKDYAMKDMFPNLKVISLDSIREAMNVSPHEEQGRVVQAALEQARVYLRAKNDFCWNTTGLTKMMRGKILSMARDYDAYTTILAMQTPFQQVLRRNRERDREVPEKVIRDLIRKWEPPSLLEAHEVHWID